MRIKLFSVMENFKSKKNPTLANTTLYGSMVSALRGYPVLQTAPADDPKPPKLPEPEEISEMLTLDISTIAMEVQRDMQFNQSKQRALGDSSEVDTSGVDAEDLFLEETLTYSKKPARQPSSPLKKEKKPAFESLCPLLIHLSSDAEDLNAPSLTLNQLQFKEFPGPREQNEYHRITSRAIETFCSNEVYPEEEMWHMADLGIDRLVSKLERMNNPLQSIKIRKPSKFDQQIEERHKIKKEHMADLQAMLDLGFESMKSKTTQQKKHFLMDFVSIAEILGVTDAVGLVVPNLISAFNSDETIHPDLYDEFAVLLFDNLPGLIRYLGKEGRKRWEAMGGPPLSETSSQSSEFSETDSTDLESRNTGYLGVLLIFDEILQPYFQPERYREELRKETLPKVIGLVAETSKYMSKADREVKVVQLILDCIQDQEDDDRRLAAVLLTAATAKSLGMECVRDNLIYELVQLQDDAVNDIRKELVSNIMTISEGLGDEILVGIMLPMFRTLATDPIWGVRKACVDTLPALSDKVSTELKEHKIVAMYQQFGKDESKWVKIAAIQNFGPFIISAAETASRDKLLDYYLVMGNASKAISNGVENGASEIRMDKVDNETAFHCAYNFPAVLQAFGLETWKDKLKPMHDMMVTDNRWKVRRSLSFSIHECAKILGPELTEKDLLPVMFHFLQDIPEVAQGALESLPSILEVLGQQARDEYIEMIVEAHDKVEKANEYDWRHKILVGKQIADLARLISTDKFNHFFVPKFFDLCLDDVFEVRDSVAKQATAPILRNIAHEEDTLNHFMDQMRYFKDSRIFTHRQTFVAMMESILVDFVDLEAPAIEVNLIEQVIVKRFVKDLTELSKDKVANVRISLAEAFYALYSKCELLDTELLNKKTAASRQSQIEILKLNLQHYLNRHFYKALWNLKQDDCETVREYLLNLTLFQRGETSYTDSESQYTYVTESFLETIDEKGMLCKKPGSAISKVPGIIDDDVHRSTSFQPKLANPGLARDVDDAIRSISATSDLLDFGAIESLQKDPISGEEEEKELTDILIDDIPLPSLQKCLSEEEPKSGSKIPMGEEEEEEAELAELDDKPIEISNNGF